MSVDLGGKDGMQTTSIYQVLTEEDEELQYDPLPSPAPVASRHMGGPTDFAVCGGAFRVVEERHGCPRT